MAVDIDYKMYIEINMSCSNKTNKRIFYNI